VQVQPEPKTTPQQMVALAEQRLDLAFGWAPELNEGFAGLLVTRDPLVLAVAEDHTLAALPAVPPEKLSGWPLIIAPQAVNPRLYELTVSQLVSAVLDWALAKGFHTVHLWVAAENLAAERRYARHGFTRTGATQPVTAGRPDRCEFAMARRLD